MINFITGRQLFEKSLVMYTENFNKGFNSELPEALDVFTRIANSVTPKILPYYHFTIESIIKSWLDQTGVPLIIVKRDDKTKKLILHQVSSSPPLPNPRTNQTGPQLGYLLRNECLGAHRKTFPPLLSILEEGRA